MDTGSKTLAQLSEENKEAKYVSIEVASKISGYTKDYLERLCHLHKVSYKLWNNGALVIELESLLRATQAILLSYEGVAFVDKNELSDPPPDAGEQPMIAVLFDQKGAGNADRKSLTEHGAQPIPRFGESEDAIGNSFSFIGRAVVSDVEPGKKNKIPEVAEVKKPEVKPIEPAVIQSEKKEVTVVKKEEVRAEEKEDEAPDEAKEIKIKTPFAELPPAVTAAAGSVHVMIQPDNSDDDGMVARTISAVPGQKVEHLQIMNADAPAITVPRAPTKVKIVGDNWDHMLLGGEGKEEEKTPEVAAVTPVMNDAKPSETPSTYRPVETSLDREAHNDPVPLFPVIEKKGAAFVVSTIPHAGAVTAVPLAPITAPQRTVVFSPAPFDTAPAGISLPSSVVMNSRIATVDSVLAAQTGAVAPSVPMKQEISTLAPIVPKRTAPTLSTIPMHEEEHHLSIYEPHPLIKSTGFNATFAVMLIAASFLLLGDTYLKNAVGSVRPASTVAAVGAALGGSALATTSAPSSEAERDTNTGGVLPFSNDIVATSGTEANTVIVQPMFPGGAGKAYEFVVVPISK